MRNAELHYAREERIRGAAPRLLAALTNLSHAVRGYVAGDLTSWALDAALADADAAVADASIDAYTAAIKANTADLPDELPTQRSER